MLLSRDVCAFLRKAGNGCKLLIKNIHVSNKYSALVSFNLSDIGEGIREVAVKEWMVKVGDRVSQFDEICEVQSDKASVTITSRYDGIVKKLYYKVDDVALVGKPLVDIEVIGTEIDEEPQISEDESSSSSSSSDSDTEGKTNNLPKTARVKEIICIPSVRRLAKKYNVDLSRVTGTGKDHRILKEDLLKFLDMSSEQDVKSRPVSTPFEPNRTEPITVFRKAMVKTMTESLKIPHLMYGDEINVSKLSKLRQDLRLAPETRDLKLSFMPFFIKAASNALSRYPILNASVDEKCENVIYKSAHNIGFAMDTKAGLAVPVIKNVERLSIIEINTELMRLINVGKSASFSAQDLAGGTFTLSNIGSIGGTYMSPVILPPQVALVALGASQILPRFDESGNVRAEEIVNVSAAADHRIIDGATIARFAHAFKKQIQNPYLLFLNL